MNYVARCSICGAIRGAVMDDGRYLELTARLVHDWILKGYKVDRVDSDNVRAGFGDCTCPKPPEPPKQGELSLKEMIGDG